jgi:hypothetical protein
MIHKKCAANCCAFFRHKLDVLGATRPSGQRAGKVYDLVQCFDGCDVPQPFDLVLDHQFPAFQFGYLQVVR